MALVRKTDDWRPSSVSHGSFHSHIDKRDGCPQRCPADDAGACAAPSTACGDTACGGRDDDGHTDPHTRRPAPGPPVPPAVSVTVTNVVSSVDMCCGVNLMDIAIRGRNTQFTPRSGQNAVLLSQRGGSTATVHASGKVVFMGGRCEITARTSARRHVRHIQTLGYPVRFRNYRVSNVSATANFGHRVLLEALAGALRRLGLRVSFDRELHPWLQVKTPTVTFMMFDSGKANITGAPSMEVIEAEVAKIRLVVWENRNEL